MKRPMLDFSRETVLRASNEGTRAVFTEVRVDEACASFLLRTGRSRSLLDSDIVKMAETKGFEPLMQLFGRMLP